MTEPGSSPLDKLKMAPERVQTPATIPLRAMLRTKRMAPTHNTASIPKQPIRARFISSRDMRLSSLRLAQLGEVHAAATLPPSKNSRTSRRATAVAQLSKVAPNTNPLGVAPPLAAIVAEQPWLRAFV